MTERLSPIQRLVRRFVSAETFARHERESREWHLICPACGHDRSVWEVGGIRAGAAGNPRWRGRCPGCGGRHWHRVERRM